MELEKSLLISDKLDKMLSGLDKSGKIDFYKKFMTSKGKTGGYIYKHIDYDSMPEDVVNFRMVSHIISEEGLDVFNQITYGDFTPERLKSQLKDRDKIEDSEIEDILIDYDILDGEIKSIIFEYIGKERLKSLKDK